MNVELITKEDFEKFKTELLSEIKLLLKTELPVPVTPKVDSETWIKSRAALKLLNCSESTLQRLRITGGVKHKKIGGSYYYLVE